MAKRWRTTTDDPNRTTRVGGAACQFHAICEGLATMELRGVELGDPDLGNTHRTWEEALTALVTGFATPVPKRAEAERPPKSVSSAVERLPSSPLTCAK